MVNNASKIYVILGEKEIAAIILVLDGRILCLKYEQECTHLILIVSKLRRMIESVHLFVYIEHITFVINYLNSFHFEFSIVHVKKCTKDTKKDSKS